jgi:hypothetical protein
MERQQRELALLPFTQRRSGRASSHETPAQTKGSVAARFAGPGLLRFPHGERLPRASGRPPTLQPMEAISQTELFELKGQWWRPDAAEVVERFCEAPKPET